LMPAVVFHSSPPHQHSITPATRAAHRFGGDPGNRPSATPQTEASWRIGQVMHASPCPEEHA